MSEIINIALIVSGLDEEYQQGVIRGINRCAKEHGANISVFSAFDGAYGKGVDIGEHNIYNLVNYEKFDGAILMLNTICDPDEKEKIASSAAQAGIPVMVLDCDDYADFYNVTIDNVDAMEQIVRHVVDHHGARNIAYVSGPLSNPEAVERMIGLKNVLESRSLTIDEDMIYYGEFRSSDGKKAVKEIFADGKMPDALICANDAMALSAVKELERRGIAVPDDVIVTGFDNTYNARYNFPAITTVGRPLDLCGQTACELLLRIIAGDDVPPVTTLETQPLFSESCGCHNEQLYDNKYIRKFTNDYIDSTRGDTGILNSLVTRLASAESLEECMDRLGELAGQLGCDELSVCLNTDWEDPYTKRNEDFMTEYTETMSAPLIWKKGDMTERKAFSSADMYPDEMLTGGNISYFLPLHFRERCLGYIILTNTDFPIESMLCYSMVMSISAAIENISKLMNLNGVIRELDRLYVIDPLCGIFNRNGFVRAADSVFKRCAAEEIPVMISFVDLEGLQEVNDVLGHNEGDRGLKQVASAIEESCSEEMICARFGGTEFIIMGYGLNEEEADLFDSKLTAALDRATDFGANPVKLTASVGTIVSDVDGSNTLFDLITEADEVMYDNKKRKGLSPYLRHGHRE